MGPGGHGRPELLSLFLLSALVKSSRGSYTYPSRRITMHFNAATALSAVLSVSLIPLASSEESSIPKLARLPAFFLAGDSTTATGSGWGTGFLSFVKKPAWGNNDAQSGATTVSFVAGSDSGRDHVISSVKKNAAKFNCFVTVQFGHNDQNPLANISLQEYQNNLRDLALNVTHAGGFPILVTPLSRRNFISEHFVEDDLHDQRIATIAAAKAAKAHFIDLNKASREYLSAIGSKAADGYSLKAFDDTHLNNRGSVVFGRIVADLLLGHEPHVKSSSVNGSKSARPEIVFSSVIKPWISRNETLSHKIWNGLPA